MRIDITCPVEATRIELRDGRAVVRLYNRSDRRVTAVEGVIRWGGRDAATASVVRADRLRAGGRRCFELTLAAPGNDPRRAVFIPSRVCFEEDSRDWVPGSGAVAEVDPLRLATDEERRALSASLGADAVCLASSGRETWRCVCGQANLLIHERCAGCGRARRKVLGWKMAAPADGAARQAPEAPVRAAGGASYGMFRRAAALVLPRLR